MHEKIDKAQIITDCTYELIFRICAPNFFANYTTAEKNSAYFNESEFYQTLSFGTNSHRLSTKFENIGNLCEVAEKNQTLITRKVQMISSSFIRHKWAQIGN